MVKKFLLKRGVVDDVNDDLFAPHFACGEWAILACSVLHQTHIYTMSQPLRHLWDLATKSWAWLLVVALAFFWLAVFLQEPLPLQSLRLAQFDQFQRWHPRTYSAQPVRVVDIDEASLTAYGQWPWPRTRIAEMVEKLHAQGAKVIAMDILLSEPDRTSPKAMAQLWRNDQAREWLQRLPDHDDQLAAMLQDKPVVLGVNLVPEQFSAFKQGASTPPPRLPYRIAVSGSAQPERWLLNFGAAHRPLPVLTQAASGLGALNSAADPDGVVRRVPVRWAVAGLAGSGDTHLQRLKYRPSRPCHG